jgi:hypothetical protein
LSLAVVDYSVYFQPLVDVLRAVRDKIHPGTDPVWAGFEDVNEVLEELDMYIQDMQACNFLQLDSLRARFAPAGPFQDLSITNGWGQDFLKFALAFDTAYRNLRQHDPSYGYKTRPSITVSRSIYIGKPKEEVWEFTQNHTMRPSWDSFVLSAQTIQDKPRKAVRLALRGRQVVTFVYKLDRRYKRTTLAATDITSPFLEHATDSWAYETKGSGTIWTLTQTIVLKKNISAYPIKWLIKTILEFQTKKAMKKAKFLLEKQCIFDAKNIDLNIEPMGHKSL